MIPYVLIVRIEIGISGRLIVVIRRMTDADSDFGDDEGSEDHQVYDAICLDNGECDESEFVSYIL